MQAIAQLKPAIPVTALVPCVENMPGSHAQRPGDIVTALSGKTIEVLNTDAEGRLILADALTYARQLGCTHLVDAATLTGAIVVALGHQHIGLFSNDDGMRDRVLAAAKAEGERMWQMPLDDEYKEYLKSAFADIGKHRRAGRRRDHRGLVPEGVCGRDALGASGYRGDRVAGRCRNPIWRRGRPGMPVRTLVRLAMDWK